MQRGLEAVKAEGGRQKKVLAASGGGGKRRPLQVSRDGDGKPRRGQTNEVNGDRDGETKRRGAVRVLAAGCACRTWWTEATRCGDGGEWPFAAAAKSV